jgi:hypothetical protein
MRSEAKRNWALTPNQRAEAKTCSRHKFFSGKSGFFFSGKNGLGVRAQFRSLPSFAGNNVVLNWDLTPKPYYFSLEIIWS